jgi:putative flippase GtrA
LWNEVWRYAIVSAVALGVDYATFVLALAVDPERYLLANSLGFLTGVAAAYAGSVWWVFAFRRYQNRLVEFTLFAAAGLGGLAVSSLVLLVAVEWLQVAPRLAKLAAVGLSFAFNFAIRRALLFQSAGR